MDALAGEHGADSRAGSRADATLFEGNSLGGSLGGLVAALRIGTDGHVAVNPEIINHSGRDQRDGASVVSNFTFGQVADQPPGGRHAKGAAA